MPKIFEERDEATVRTLDALTKNKFDWEWLDKQVNSISIGDFYKKKMTFPAKLCLQPVILLYFIEHEAGVA